MKTLQLVLDNYLGYPQYIHLVGGRVAVRTSSRLILGGQVYINGMQQQDPGKEVVSGQLVKFGYKDSFYVP